MALRPPFRGGPGYLLLLLVSLGHTAPLFSHAVVARSCDPALACLPRAPTRGGTSSSGFLRSNIVPLRGGGLEADMGLQKRLVGESQPSAVADRALTKKERELLGAVRQLPDESCAERVRDLLSKGALAGYPRTPASTCTEHAAFFPSGLSAKYAWICTQRVQMKRARAVP